MPDNVQDNVDCSGFGYRWDDKQNKYGDSEWTDSSTPGILPGYAQTVSFKPFLSLMMQPKLLPVKYAPIILDLELVNSNLDPVITPGVRNVTGSADPVFNTL